MAKLKAEPITLEDIKEYLREESDFSFEMQTLDALRREGVDCEHGGHYSDPVTGLSREFDIRASVTFRQLRLRMAIECKNIRDNFPLLISCVPRQEHESYHQIAAAVERDENPALGYFLKRSRVNAYSVVGEHCIYPEGAPVGKSTAQVGRSVNGDITANDGEIFSKWGQSLASVADLVAQMYWDGDEDDPEDGYISAVIPALVVPDGRLWTVEYDSEGGLQSEPMLVDRCSCYVDKAYPCKSSDAGTTYWISHLEIFTAKGMNAFVSDFMQSEAGLGAICTRSGLHSAVERMCQEG